MHSFQGVTAESKEAIRRAFQDAWYKPLPDRGAIRAMALLSLGQRSDGSFGPNAAPSALLRCSPNEPELASCVAHIKVDHVGSAIWLEPPGIVLMGVATLIGGSCRRHLLQGMAQLRDAFAAELDRVCHDQLVGFDYADALVRSKMATAEECLDVALRAAIGQGYHRFRKWC